MRANSDVCRKTELPFGQSQAFQPSSVSSTMNTTTTSERFREPDEARPMTSCDTRNRTARSEG